MCKGFLYSLKHDVDFRVFLAQCFGAFSSFIFSIFVMPDKWLLTTLVLSFLLSYLLWRIFPGGLAFFISVLLLVGTAVYVTFPIAGTIVFGIQEFRKSYRPQESDISRGPLITRPHEDITFASELEMKDFNATELAEVLGNKLGISSKMFRIRIRSEKPFTFVLEVYPPAEAKESELNKTIAQLIGEIKRLLSEQNEFRKFKMREHYTESFSSEDEILGGEAVVELIYGPRITLSGKNDICEGEIANITFNMDGTGPWNITYYDQYGREYSLFTTISPYTQSIRVNSSRVFSLEAPERHTPTRSLFFDTAEPEIVQVVHVSHDRFCPAYLKLGKAVVDVHPIPAADIYGGGIICEGDTANISITIDGVPPFSIVYTAGDGSIITESELQSNIYSFKYGNNGDFQIQSVASSHCINNTKSQIVPVRVNPLPTATVSSGKCMYDVVMVKFTGDPPYSLTYSTGEEDITQRDIYQSPYLIPGDNPHYIFKNISDRNCRGKVIDGPVHVDLLPLPEAHISGSGSFFEGGFVELTVELTGTPPWTFTYTSGNAHETINVDYTPYKIRANKEGKYRLASVRDANCAGTTSGSSTVTMYKLPSAVVKVRSDPKTIWDYTTKICEGAQAQVRFELSGSPPFRVSYTDGKENFTLQNIDDFEYIFNTRMPGVYRLTEIEDVYKNIVVLHVSANIETISLPTAKITGAGEYCEDDPVKLDVSFTGSPPWFIVYKQNKKVKRETNINQMPYSLQVTEDGTYTLETVGDRFCTNGNLDESTSTAVISRKPLPSCTVLGGHVIGQDLVVNCTGTPPYTFIYTEGVNQITKQSNEPEFRIPTESSGWYNFLEVVDNTGCRKLLQSSQFVNELPKAVLIKGKEQICEGETSELTITLTGSPPWVVTLSKNGHLTKIENIMSSPFTYVASEAGLYKLVAVGDSNSRYGTVEGEAEVSLYHTPAAVIEGGGEICANERANLTVHLTGTPPWTFSYTNGSVTKAETMVEHSPIQISVRGTEMSGRIWIAEVSDSHNCLGKPTETFVEVVVYPIPKAHLSGGGVICVGSKTYLNLTLSGEPPFYIEYTDGETVSSISNILISPHLEEVEKAGTYYLTAIQDRHCSYRRKK